MLQARKHVKMSTGHRSMVSLNSHLACTAAEALQASQPSSVAHRTKLSRVQRSSMFVATWNVRSLLESEGSVETARQTNEVQLAEDRKIDRVIKECDRYGVKIAALQETKWFGNAVYRVKDSVVLAAGRPAPQKDELRQRGEGVSIVLLSSAVNLWKDDGEQWKDDGEQWKGWSSRIITARIKWNCGERHTHLHIVSCYAPTYAASREDRNKFYDDLQLVLDKIPSEELYILLGNFNARMGGRQSSDDQWTNVGGPHGFGALNDAGKEFLSFLSVNEATLCNTWFMKRGIQKGT